MDVYRNAVLTRGVEQRHFVYGTLLQDPLVGFHSSSNAGKRVVYTNVIVTQLEEHPSPSISSPRHRLELNLEV
jgi:hypothetical protein